MKSKLLLFALLLMGVSAGAQTAISVSIFDDCSQNGITKNYVPSGTENGYTWVNLGLSVMWATVNVGATNPEDYGNYYAWGETTTKSDYSWSTYKYGERGNIVGLTKYNTSLYYGHPDNITGLEPADDAAHVNWGGNWRMPYRGEWIELYTQCTWTWTTQNGVNGYRVTATNGNSIFLPAAGYRDETSLYYAGSYGRYWSSTLDAYGPQSAWRLYFNSSTVTANSTGERYYGLSVRAVCP